MRAKPPVPSGLRSFLKAAAIVVLYASSALASVALEPANIPSRASAESLPDAPEPHLTEIATTAPLEPASAPAAEPFASVDSTAQASKITPAERDAECQSGVLRGKPCRVRWLPILWQSFEVTAIQNLGNIALDDETRHDLASNPYWATYAKCVHQFRYRQWRDDDDFLVDYVAHGMQGGWAASVFEQNDPKGRGLIYVNNGNYWRSRLKAMAWITVYEVQWKIGPASEASIGNSGLNTYYTPRVQGRTTNETGFQDFVDTPVIGFWWNVGEDALDRFLMPRIWSRTHNKLVLSSLFFLTPCKAAANIMRYKPLYYRDFPLTPLR